MLDLSKATISYYLNGHYQYMSEQTRDLIKETIEKVNYYPNHYARNLKSKKTKTVGIIISNLVGADIAHYFRGMYEILRADGYRPILYTSYGDPHVESECLNACMDQQVDGIIVRPASEDFSRLTKMCEKGIPVVLFDQFREHWKYDAAYIDQRKIVAKALEHMWFNGYTKIWCLVNDHAPIDTKGDRLRAFVSFSERRLHIPGEALARKVDSAYPHPEVIVNQIITEIAARYPGERTGIFVAGGTQLLWHVLYEMRAQHIEIPQDMGICTVDSTWRWCQLIQPGITAIYQPCFELGAASARLLLNRMAGSSSEPVREVLKAELVVGNSTAVLGKKNSENGLNLEKSSKK
jgi:LacI family kdg operon repressor